MKLPGSIGVGLGLGAVALVGVGIAAYLLYKNRERFDPTSDKNFAYQGSNALTQAITGDPYATTGTKAFDAIDTIKGWFGFGEVDLSKPVTQADIEAYRMNKKAAQENGGLKDVTLIFGGGA